jgi:hypothetical protein
LVNFGAGDYSVEDPLYSYLRRIDYTGYEFLATPRNVFESLGGFDTAFRFASYAHADYCFAARAAGWTSYYQPDVNLVNVADRPNPDAAGGDMNSADHRQFQYKWRARLERLPVRRLWYDRDAWHGEAVSNELQEVTE